MSIYCTRLMIGDDDPATLPSPIAYQGSHVRIVPDARRFGMVDTAHIPPWCAHDAGSDDLYGPPVPYLRLGVAGWDRHDETEVAATVVLDEQQVRALRDDFTAWLEAIATGEELA